VIAQKGKRFVERFVVSIPKAEVAITNMDKTKHNIYSEDKENGISFDMGEAEPGVTRMKEIDWDGGKIVRIGCKIHPKMRAWIATIDSNYSQAIKKKRKMKTYAFDIKGIPDSLEKVRIWVPEYGEILASLESATTLNLEEPRRKSPYVITGVQLTRK
jgi:hypothetical protein